MKSRCKKIDALKRLPSIELHPSFEKFPNFLEIMGPRPEPSWSIDRIDPLGPYFPDNVRWASKTTQARNRTNTVYLTQQGITLPLVECAEKLGVDADTLRRRKKNGWSDEEIITGRKVQASSRIATSASTSSRNPLDHTPWPKNIQETMEREYQQLKKSDEHRLLFWKRYALEAMERISIQGESISWPDDYLATDEQLVEVEELDRLHKRYQAILADANKKLSPDHPPRLYKRRHLPEWVEERLEKYR